jgi:hypothetical protein
VTSVVKRITNAKEADEVKRKSAGDKAATKVIEDRLKPRTLKNEKTPVVLAWY